MIALLCDKFKGTLSGREVADIISDILPDCVYIPMADGGEGTAEALGAVLHGDFYIFEDTDGTIAAYVPSCGEGIRSFPNQEDSPLSLRSSAPVGQMVASALEHHSRVYVGIGGTRTADGGVGFADQLKNHSGQIIGLADVAGPLIPTSSEISALSFLAQKGATENDFKVLSHRFSELKKKYPSADRFGAAGGGIGFAIESILGGEVIPGAQYILKRNLKKYLGGRRPALVITGEGCVDEQTAAGKVVSTVNEWANAHQIPVVTFAGTVKGDSPYPHTFPSFSSPPAVLPSTEEAKNALKQAVINALPLIKSLTS